MYTQTALAWHSSNRLFRADERQERTAQQLCLLPKTCNNAPRLDVRNGFTQHLQISHNTYKYTQHLQIQTTLTILPYFHSCSRQKKKKIMTTPCYTPSTWHSAAGRVKWPNGMAHTAAMRSTANSALLPLAKNSKFSGFSCHNNARHHKKTYTPTHSLLNDQEKRAKPPGDK